MATNPDAVEKRLGLARRVADHLAANTELTVSLLTGSVAQGTCDDASDIDLLNYYETLPERARFDEVLAEVGARLTGELSPPGAPEFAARYDLAGIELQSGAQRTSSLEATLDRIAAGEVDWATAKVAMGLQEGVALHGEDRLVRWQSLVDYPEALRRKEVTANLGFFPIWRLESYLATRDAAIFQREMLLDGAFRVLAIAAALNRLYFSRFQVKRVGDFTERMALKPERLAERLRLVVDGPATEAGQELSRLVDEVKGLVRSELPDVDLEQPWMPPGAGAA